MNRFYIVTRFDKKSQELAKTIQNKLEKLGYVLDKSSPEIVIVAGGDGSVLQAISQFIDQLQDILFVGIKTGTLGFMCDYKDDEVDRLIEDITSKTLTVKKYPLLEGVCDGIGHHFLAVNEIRVENIVKTLGMKVYIDDVYFEEYQGTGMCVCTQLGSSAYNRSLGGAVIQEGLDLMEMTQVAGIHHSEYRSLQSPLILAGSSTISFESNDFNDARLGVDALSFPLEGTTKISITLSNRYFQLVRHQSLPYLKRLARLF